MVVMKTNKQIQRKSCPLGFLKNKTPKQLALLAVEILAIILLFYVVKIVNKANYTPTNWGNKPDIHYEYMAAQDIGDRVNPYKRVLDGNMVWNKKYATLFPLYYYFLLGIAWFSKFVFIDFYHNFGKVLYLFQFIAFIFTYLQFRRYDKKVLGFVAGAFLVLNRWSIASVSSSKQDFIAIAFIMASFYFFEKKPKVAYLLYGFSLGIKHLGIFFAPIYLLPLITGERKFKEFLSDLALIAIPILIPSIPFMIDDIKSFFMSIMFSFTRTPESDTGILYGYQKLLTLYNTQTYNNVSTFTLMLPRLPLVVFSLLNVFLFFTKRIGKFYYVLFAIVIFISFNPVYFDQYLLWMTPFVFYSIVDTFQTSKENGTKALHGK